MGSNELKKTLGVSAALSTVVGSVIGAGVFFKPQAVYTLTGGAPGLGILAWLIAGIITITAGLTAAEVSVAIPKNWWNDGIYKRNLWRKIRFFNWMDANCIILSRDDGSIRCYIWRTSISTNW